MVYKVHLLKWLSVCTSGKPNVRNSDQLSISAEQLSIFPTPKFSGLKKTPFIADEFVAQQFGLFSSLTTFA